MPNAEDILWFKQQFAPKIATAIHNTPFSIDMVVAVACQETGHIWQNLRKRQLSVAQILELCVGDTLDASKGRKAFPKTKADLVAKPDGQQMFDIARKALIDMAQFIPGFQGAANNPNKFCHGFGVFQLDLQFFLVDPSYFLQKRYADFDASLGKCVTELTNAAKRIGFKDKTVLTDLEMAAVAIAYNTGGFKPAKGLKQGHFDGKKFYGEHFFDFLRLSKTVIAEGTDQPVISTPPIGNALLATPTPVTASGPLFEVDVQSDPLRLRSQPKVDSNNANVLTRLPDGHRVQAVTNNIVNGFLEVETSLAGAHFRGFASAKHLKPSGSAEAVAVLVPSPTPPASGIVAVFMPRKQASVTKRTQLANAHTLNEPGQPERKGTTADELRTEIDAIIKWLAVDKATHIRYQPRDGLTFCNIYAHDFCFLAGVYLPRVWWTPGAIELLAQGQTVQPLIENTITEVRANSLFRWLRDFGIRFGWRQTGTLDKLQTEVNQGAIGLIVARRREDGRSGHIVMVVPETNEVPAKRNASGEVIAPVQSQAGVVNFRHSTGKLNWWKGEQFAESAFWIHA